MLTKKNKIKLLKLANPKSGLLLLIAILLVGLALYIININVVTSRDFKNRNNPNLSQPDLSYKNLNLNMASKTTFSGSRITMARDLGSLNSVRHQIIKFNVYKDNLVESALMTLPSTPEPTNGYPVIILCHGYVNPIYYSTLKAYLPDMQFYSQHGFVVIKPDFRGQGYSIGQGSPEGAYYSMAYNTDVLSLVASIKQTPYLNKNNINLWGHSMGAYVALRASVLSHDIKNTILLAGPVGNIQDMFSAYIAISDTNNAVAGSIRAAQLSLHKTPLNNPKYWDTTSPLNYLKNSKAFYQIHAGSADQIVPPKFSADLDNALTKNNQKHEYFIYQGGDHGLMKLRDSIWTRSLARLNSATY